MPDFDTEVTPSMRQAARSGDWRDYLDACRAENDSMLPGDTEQWDRVRSAARNGDARAQERARVAARDARMFGTDPSWFGF